MAIQFHYMKTTINWFTYENNWNLKRVIRK